MGHGIAQIFAAAGHPVALHDPDPTILASAPERVAAIFDLLAQDKAGLKNHPLRRRFRRCGRGCRFRLRGRPGKARGQTRDLQESRREGETRRDPLHQYLGDTHCRRRPGRRRPAARRRHALLEPTSSRAAGRGGAGKGHLAGDGRKNHCIAESRRQSAGPCSPRHPRLHRQSLAACVEARGDRLGRGGCLRCRDARYGGQGRFRRADGGVRAVGAVRSRRPQSDARYSQNADRRSRSHARAASLSRRQGREGRARHEDRPRLPRLDTRSAAALRKRLSDFLAASAKAIAAKKR